MNLIPTTTGSATAITLIYPELKGRLNGHAIRVPLLNASLTDCVFEVERPTTVEEVNALFAAAAEGPLQGILGYETRALVSSDFTNDPRSSIIDAHSTMVVNGTQVKIYAWYDNEWGYACRLGRHHPDGGRIAVMPVHLSPKYPGRVREGSVLPGAAKSMTAANPLRAYAAVTAAYWAFMLSDGALRMLVLLHFNGLGFSPIQLAWLFLLYEMAGIVTNLAAGWLAARFGLASTLYAGLTLQIGALVALTLLDPAWSIAASVIFVDGGAGGVGGGEGPGQDVVEIRRQALGPSRGRRALPLGRGA